MKKTIIFYLILVFLLVSGITIFAQNAKITHPNSSDKYNENPTPIYAKNNNTEIENFVTEDKCLKNIVQKSDSIIISKELKTWGKHVSDEKEEGINYQIDPERMVRVIKVKYPQGLDTKAGFYKNAIAINVFDAETGNLIESTVTGDYQGRQHKK